MLYQIICDINGTWNVLYSNCKLSILINKERRYNIDKANETEK